MEVPEIEVDHLETPSPLNPLGVKGAGEAGVIPGPALMAQALDDALSEFGIPITEMPLSPNRLFEIIRNATARRPIPPPCPLTKLAASLVHDTATISLLVA